MAPGTAGPSGFGYDDSRDNATVLTDMRGGYTSLYIRKTFQLADPSRVESLVLGMLIDNGYVAYLNGTEIDPFNVAGSPGTPPAFGARAINILEPRSAARWTSRPASPCSSPARTSSRYTG